MFFTEQFENNFVDEGVIKIRDIYLKNNEDNIYAPYSSKEIANNFQMQNANMIFKKNNSNFAWKLSHTPTIDEKTYFEIIPTGSSVDETVEYIDEGIRLERGGQISFKSLKQLTVNETSTFNDSVNIGYTGTDAFLTIRNNNNAASSMVFKNDEIITNATINHTGNINISDTISVKNININSLNWADKSELDYVEFKSNNINFKSGFLMDDIQEATVSNDAEIIIRENGVFVSKALSGELTLNKTGSIILNNNIIENRHFSTTMTYGEKIDIYKTKLSVASDNRINLNVHTLSLNVIAGYGLKWDPQTTNKLNFFVEDQSITNVGISDTADISMFKTNFSPNIEQITYNGIDGNLEIKDIYVKNTGDIINGNVEIIGNFEVKNDEIILNNNDDTKLIIKDTKIEHYRDDVLKSHMGFDNSTDLEFKFKNNVGDFNFDSKVGIGISATEQLDVNGDVKIRGNVGIKMIDNTDGNILLANNSGFNSTTISGAFTLNNTGVATFNNGVIKNAFVSNENTDRIDISKTTLAGSDSISLTDNILSVDTDGLIGLLDNNHISSTNKIKMTKIKFIPDLTQFVYDELNGSISIDDIYIKKSGNNVINGNLDINGNLNIKQLEISKEGDVELNIVSTDNNESALNLGDDWKIYNKSKTNDLIFYSKSRNKNEIYINELGVGLGFDTPTEQLDVNGNVKIRGNIGIKMIDNTDGNILLANNSGFNSTTISGAFTLINTGVASLTDGCN